MAFFKVVNAKLRVWSKNSIYDVGETFRADLVTAEDVLKDELEKALKNGYLEIISFTDEEVSQGYEKFYTQLQNEGMKKVKEEKEDEKNFIESLKPTNNPVEDNAKFTAVKVEGLRGRTAAGI